MNKKGFTLAEVLITLGIIGVIAALTFPSLMSSYNKKVASTRLKKFYSTMQQAILLAKAEYGDVEYWSRTGNLAEDEESETSANYTATLNYWNKYFAPQFYTLKVEPDKRNRKNLAIYLTDGSKLSIWNGGCLDIRFDVNGDNNPNTLGVDEFYFTLCESEYERNYYHGDKNIIFSPYYAASVSNRTSALEACKNNPTMCAALVVLYDGFEFAKDYPYKL